MSVIRKSISSYLRTLYLDYYEVFRDIHKSAKRRPLKTCIGVVGVGFVLNLFRSNEGIRSYSAEIISASNKMSALVESSRNPESYGFVQKLAELNCQRRLRQIDLGFSTLIYEADISDDLALYKHNCKYLRPTLKEFVTERIIDWGILGHWLQLERKMKDYDINEADLLRSVIESNKIGNSLKEAFA